MTYRLPSSKDMSNLISLGLIQAANSILPLAVFPYVLHIVGNEKFADIVWTESVALISLGFILYSFDVDGVRRLISLRRNQDTSQRDHLFYTILWTRLLIYAVISVFVLIGVFFLYRKVFPLQASWLLYSLGHILHSAWFFQATEKNLFVATSTVVSRLACALLIYISIARPESYLYVPLIIGGSYLLSGFIAFMYANFHFGIRFSFPTIPEVLTLLTHGWHIFSGNISVILFRGSSVILLKALSSDSSVSAYSVAEKIVKCTQAVVRPLNQFSYPKIVSKIKEYGFFPNNIIIVILKYTTPQLLFLLVFYVISISIYFCAHKLGFNVGEIGKDVLVLLMIMACATFFGVCNFMFGTAGLNALGLDRFYARAIFFTGISTLLISVFLIILFNAVGASLSFVLGEMLLLFSVMKILHKFSQEQTPN